MTGGEPHRRAATLRAALAFARLDLRPEPPALAALRRYLGSWTGLGAIARGMGGQGCDLQLTRYAEEGWRATFYPAGLAHSVVLGSGWAPTPGEAVQQAAWEVLARVLD